MAKSVVTWRGGRNLDHLESSLAARGAGGARVLSEVLEDIADEAVDRMVKIIETTPSGLVPGKIGRVYTGHMRDSVDRTPVISQRIGRGSDVSVRFGWTKDQEEYFLFQENGGLIGHSNRGIRRLVGVKEIPPMHALHGAFVWAREELRSRISHLRSV